MYVFVKWAVDLSHYFMSNVKLVIRVNKKPFRLLFFQNKFFKYEIVFFSGWFRCNKVGMLKTGVPFLIQEQLKNINSCVSLRIKGEPPISSLHWKFSRKFPRSSAYMYVLQDTVISIFTFWHKQIWLTHYSHNLAIIMNILYYLELI